MNGCRTGKVVYASPQAAWKALESIRGRTGRAPKRHGGRDHVIRCAFCGQWHTTSSNRRSA